MSKRSVSVLLLTSLLTGCNLSMPTAKLVSQPETEYVTDLKTNVHAKVFPASAAVPTKAANQTNRPGQAGRAATTSAAKGGQATAGNEGTAAAEDATRPAYLKVEASETASPRLVPMFDDERKLTGVMTQPSTGELTWRLVSMNGPTKVSKWRVAYRSIARYPDPVAPTAETKGPPSMLPVPEEGQPVFSEVDADALGLPESFVVGKAQTLTWSLKNDFTREAIAANPRTAKLQVGIVPHDEAGQPMVGPDGKPVLIETLIAVL